MNFSIKKFVPVILKERPGERMTARQIAQIIMEKFPEAVEKKRQNSRAIQVSLNTDDAMLAQIVAEIGSQRRALVKHDPRIKTVDERPRRFFFTEQTDLDEVSTGESEELEHRISRPSASLGVSEQELYPLLASYLMLELGVHPKRIDERRSTNNRGSGGNRWLYPDVVGMEDLSRKWSREIVDFAKEYSDKKTKLWSLEVKLKLNSSNVREAYFQAVSNSSWSNIGYLVAAEIQGEQTTEELRMLAGLHGIGVIQLNLSEISESQILIPARERTEVDWHTMNRLLEQNSDFLDYVRIVRQFYQTGDPRSGEWDAQP